MKCSSRYEDTTLHSSEYSKKNTQCFAIGAFGGVVKGGWKYNIFIKTCE